MLAIGGVLVGGVALAFLAGGRMRDTELAQPKPALSRAGFETAYDRLRTWCRRPDNESSDVARDMTRLERGEIFEPAAAALLPVPNGDGYVYVCHLFWTVAVCWMDDDYSIRSVEAFNGKAGFSISWDHGLIVTCHEHPGTGLFFDTARRVHVDRDRLAIETL